MKCHCTNILEEISKGYGLIRYFEKLPREVDGVLYCFLFSFRRIFVTDDPPRLSVLLIVFISLLSSNLSHCKPTEISVQEDSSCAHTLVQEDSNYGDKCAVAR